MEVTKELLVVTGDDVAAGVIGGVCRDLGLQSLLCPSVNHARGELFGARRPAVAIVDSRNGDVRRIKGMFPGIKLIAMIDRPTTEEELAVRREGVLFLMVKPVGCEVLRNVLKRAYEHETTRMRRVG